MRFSGTITATVGAMLVGAAMANFPSPSPNGPSPNGPSPNGPSPNGPGPGPELSSLEERSASAPLVAHPYSVFAAGPSSAPFSPGPSEDHPLEVRSDASSPFSPSPAGPGPKVVSPGPSPGSDHTLEVRSDASSPSPAGPASENHPHPHQHSSGSDHTLFARDESPGLLVPPREQSAQYHQVANTKAGSNRYVGMPEEKAAKDQEHWALHHVADVQEERTREFDIAVAQQDIVGLAKLDEWNKLSQQERDTRDLAAAKEISDAKIAKSKKKNDERLAELDLWREAREDAEAKKQAELDQRAQKMKNENTAKRGNQVKKPGPVDDEPAAPPVDKEAEEKAKVEAERKFAEKLAADEATAEDLKKETEAKLAAEKEEAKKAEQAAADKLAAEKEAAKDEKKKIDEKLAEQKDDDKTDPEKLSADKEAAKIEKQKADEKLAEEKTAAEEVKKAAEAKLAEEKKEEKKEEKDAAAKLKEEKEAAEKEEKAEKLRGHFDPSKHAVERIAKPKSCSCFDAFSHVLGFETKTSSPMDKFRFEFWGVKNRKCIEYCTHPFSKSEFESYRASMEGKAVLPEKLPEHFSIEAGMSSGALEKREEHATPHGARSSQEAMDRLLADMDELKKTQANITGTLADEKDEQDMSNDNLYTPEPPKPLDPSKAKLYSAAFPEYFAKSNGKDSKKITNPKTANNELTAAYNLYLVEFKNSLKKQRSGLEGDVKALKQLEQQAAKTLEDAEKNFIKASEEAAAAAAVDMRKETFKELTQDAKKPKSTITENLKKLAAAKAEEGVAGKAPVHPENANTGIIPPA